MTNEDRSSTIAKKLKKLGWRKDLMSRACLSRDGEATGMFKPGLRRSITIKIKKKGAE